MFPPDMTSEYHARIHEVNREHFRNEVRARRSDIAKANLSEENNQFLTQLNEHINDMLNSFEFSYKQVHRRTNFLKGYISVIGKSYKEEIKYLSMENIAGLAGYTSKRFYNMLNNRKLKLARDFVETLPQGSAKRDIVAKLLSYIDMRNAKRASFMGKATQFINGEDAAKRERFAQALIEFIVDDDVKAQHRTLAEDNIHHFKGLFSQTLYDTLCVYRTHLETLDGIKESIFSKQTLSSQSSS